MRRKRLTPSGRERVYEKCLGHCAYCGCDLELEDMQVDHVTPLHNGGADTFENMLPACRSCNLYKDTMCLENFRKMVARMPDTLHRDSAAYRIAVRFGNVIPDPKEIVFYFEKMENLKPAGKYADNPVEAPVMGYGA